MKRLFLYLLLILFILQTLSRADDIRDFQIEGMSINDSALDFFSEKEIKKNINDFTSDDKFTMTCLVGNFKNYDEVCLMFRSSDKKYIIHGISGQIEFRNSDIKQKKIDDQILIDFKKLKRQEWGKIKLDPKVLEIDPSATYNPITYDFKNDKERLQIACYDFALTDLLKIALYSEDYGRHITYDAIEAN